MKELNINPSMLDIIEHTNGDIVCLMVLAFLMGIMVSVVLFYCPLVAKFDTFKRTAETDWGKCWWLTDEDKTNVVADFKKRGLL
jgi:hypothetical protein